MERKERDLKSKSKANYQIIDSYLFLFEFDHATKMKEIQFDVQICRQIHSALMNGFKQGKNGDLWGFKVLSTTGQTLICRFKDIDTCQNHHDKDTIEALSCQKLYTTLIGTPTKVRDLFDCLPILICMIESFNDEHLGTAEKCVYPFKLKYIDILFQISNGVLGGK